MKKITMFLKENVWAMTLSIVLPILIIGIAYYRQGIYFGSEATLLASDAFAQFSNFYASFNNVLQGKQSIFYTWSGSLGLNYWSLAAYYLNGLFTPIVSLFHNSQIPDAMYCITLLKFGAMGGTFWIYSNQTFKLSKWITVGLSVCFALMSYTVSYSPMIMWLDAMVFLPLIILGIDRLMDQRKSGLLFTSYLLLFLSNFYMAFMVGVFSFLYFLARLLTDWQRYKKSLGLYLVVSLLAGGASMVTILPTVFDLKSNGESLTAISQILTPDTGIWDIIAKNMVGVYDTSKYEAAPFIYIGLLPLLFCLFYFSTKKIPLKNKLSYGSIGVILIASVYIQPLNLFWHGLHSPNMFLFRFSFLLSFLVLMLAAFGLEKFEKEDQHTLINIGIAVIAMFILTVIASNKKRYSYISGESLIYSIVFVIIYVILFIALKKIKGKQSIFYFGIMLVLICEIFMNTGKMLEGVRSDWGYPKRELYSHYYKDISNLVDQTKKENKQFYRMANLNPISQNESFNYGYSGVTMFSSIRNRNSSSYLNDLGFRSTGSNLYIDYQNNTLLMDTLLGIKYNISKDKPMKYGFEKEQIQGAYTLYKNSNALPLAIRTSKEVYKEGQNKSQEDLLNYLAGTNEKLFYFKLPKEVSTENLITEYDGDIVYYSEERPGSSKSITWSLDVPANSQAYINLLAEDSSMMRDAVVEVEVNGVLRTADMPRSGQYFNVGYYQEATTVTIKASFRGVPVVKLMQPDGLILDTKAFDKVMKPLKEKGVDFKVEGRKAVKSLEVTGKEEALLTTIPYDKGWKAYIDGKETKIQAFNKAFLAVNVPNGKHKIEFIFLPQGFKIGAVLFVFCTSLFLLLYWREHQMLKATVKDERTIE
ncbi:YfhO family protein [Enterococcus plantarum]|uniref:YfhO family protein n=1 Tax=Enterococcus plantarum TaxID=1077675 RepID=UPI001A8C4B7C|nr:YfhO family protein [Enterococcus plantarum]MBO0466147.1 YfhO family protein [Enterococcus plantarum]